VHDVAVEAPDPKMATETYLLTSGHYQIEVMANLDKVPAK
jgi:kynurenine formamidase